MLPHRTEPPVDPTAESLLELLEDARRRTLALVAPVRAYDLTAQHDPLMSPIVWDLGHIAHFEELWLLRNTEGPVEFGEMPGIYNPFEHPRATRGVLELPSVPETLALLAGVRAHVVERVRALNWTTDDPLLRGGYVVRLVAQHEHQHNETMLQAMQLKGGTPYAAPRAWDVPAARPVAHDMVRVPAGEYPMGTDDRTWAYDNERPRHRVALPAFEIDRVPVTNGAYLAFIDDGGYERRELWSDAGWQWRRDADAHAPRYWERRDAQWTVRTMDRVCLVPPDHPVCHVSWYEAEAYARWAGKRLPTEAEWEVAATWDAARGVAHAEPWGEGPATPALANVDQLAFGTAPVGAYPDGASPAGCLGMIGDVWEWTASDFTGYPGFVAFPYPEYSEVFFGPDSKVLRGGSWATRAPVARATFRNWDYPVRRQIFAGFRCARDA
jgi:iron(II)-dependent oxidoreductase